jgi:hypothetical protein
VGEVDDLHHAEDDGEAQTDEHERSDAAEDVEGQDCGKIHGADLAVRS